MTAEELITILQQVPPDHEVIIRVNSTDGDGYNEAITVHTGYYEEEEPEHSITEGFCALNAGYPHHFKTPKELEKWRQKYDPTAYGWVPASIIVINTTTNW